MRVLSGFTPHLEIYSIDEAFLGLSGFEARLETHARELRQTVLQWTGIPVSVGIAPTKTLAKVANRIAKKDAASGGVRCLLDEAAQREALAKLELTDPWGIARRLGARLSAIGITTPLELRDADHRLMRERFSVVLERMVLELRGVACIALEEVTPDRKSLIASRSFGQPVETRRGLEEAVSVYTARAAEKMRRQNLATALANRRHRPCPSVVRPLRAGGPEVFEGGSFRAVLDLENPLPPDHPGVQRFSSAARLRSAGYGGCDGCYDRRSGAADASMGVDAVRMRRWCRLRKHTIGPRAPEPQPEPRGGLEFELMQSGRDRPRWGGVMRFEDAAVDGRNAQTAVTAQRDGERVKSTFADHRFSP